MKFLVDVNVISEPTKLLVSPKVIAWLRANEADLVVDSVVMAEIWRGVVAMPSGRRKQDLIVWFDQVRATVRCLDWSIESAIAWGELVNVAKASGFTIGAMDTLIAATAKHHGLTVATRNVDDFTRCGVPVVNPFE